MKHKNLIPEQNSNGKGKLPALHFYPGDWAKDPGIQALDLFHRGLWLELLFRMHESPERGVLLLNGKPYPIEALAHALRVDKQILTNGLTKLLDYGVASMREDGAIFSRRMVRDEDVRQKRIKAGFMGGNPDLLKQKSTKDTNAGYLCPESENETEDLNLKKNSRPPSPPLEQRGKHLRMTPDDWQKLENEFGSAVKTELPEADRWIEDNKTCDKNARKYARSGHNHYLFFRGWLKRNVESVPKIAHSNGHNPPPRPQPPPFKPPKPTPPPTPEQRAEAKKLTSEFFERVKNEH